MSSFRCARSDGAMKLRFYPPFKDEGEVVASWGRAQLIKYLNRTLELKGGSKEDRVEAREWISMFSKEEVVLSRPWDRRGVSAQLSLRLGGAGQGRRLPGAVCARGSRAQQRGGASFPPFQSGSSELNRRGKASQLTELLGQICNARRGLMRRSSPSWLGE